MTEGSACDGGWIRAICGGPNICRASSTRSRSCSNGGTLDPLMRGIRALTMPKHIREAMESTRLGHWASWPSSFMVPQMHGDKIRNADRMRLNTEEEVGRVHCDWYDTIFTRDLSPLVALWRLQSDRQLMGRVVKCLAQGPVEQSSIAKAPKSAGRWCHEMMAAWC